MADRYLLDTNVFIQAHRRYYAFDLCPGFWLGLVDHHQAKRIFSIDRVRDELLEGNDGLATWVKETAPDTFFKGTVSDSVTDVFRELINWVQDDSNFTVQAKAEFAAVADGWLVAYAATHKLKVVTHEEYRPDAKNRIPIPNLCVEFDVEYCNAFDMLRDLKLQFVLRTKRRPRK